MTLESLPYRYIVAVDTEYEFGGVDGNRPRPVCLVARELRSGQTWRLWRGEFGPQPPFPIGSDSLIVGFYTSAEFGVFRQLGWPMPARVLDLFCEQRCQTNGRREPGEKDSLVGALTYYALDTIGAHQKQSMVDLILTGGPWTESERCDIFRYCEDDVDAVARLLAVMLPRIDLAHGLLRGRYMANGASAMEHSGIPVDVSLWNRLVAQWDSIKLGLIEAIDVDYHVHENGVFRLAHGSEMLRIACCLGTERGVEICGPIHDAVLICAPLERLDQDIVTMRAAMAEASRAVLGGFELRTDAVTVKYPDRFMDEKRGRKMWDQVMRLLVQAEGAQALRMAG
jgi:hypothetical protein